MEQPHERKPDQGTEYPHDEDHDSGYRRFAAYIFRYIYRNGHRHRFRHQRVLNEPRRPQKTGYVHDAQNAHHAARYHRGENRQHLPAHSLLLLVKQVAQRHHRHAEPEVEDPRRLAICLVRDAGHQQEPNQRQEGDDYGMQQRYTRAAVYRRAGTIYCDRECEKECLRLQELVYHLLRIF